MRCAGGVVLFFHEKQERKLGMKTKLHVIAAGAAFCMASAALADGGLIDGGAFDIPVVLNGGEAITLETGDTYSQSVSLDNDGLPVGGFSFAGNFTDLGDSGTWASDTRLDIVAPDGSSYSIGGFGAGAGDNDWDFQGAGSSDNGSYFHGIGGELNGGDGKPDFGLGSIPRSGEWTFTLTQTFGSATWKGVAITLHKVPAPGALALLGLAGLAGARRRRA
jgi:hypothetical protein